MKMVLVKRASDPDAFHTLIGERASANFQHSIVTILFSKSKFSAGNLSTNKSLLIDNTEMEHISVHNTIALGSLGYKNTLKTVMTNTKRNNKKEYRE